MVKLWGMLFFPASPYCITRTTKFNASNFPNIQMPLTKKLIFLGFLKSFRTAGYQLQQLKILFPPIGTRSNALKWFSWNFQLGNWKKFFGVSQLKKEEQIDKLKIQKRINVFQQKLVSQIDSAHFSNILEPSAKV